MDKLRVGLVGCGGRMGAHINSLLQMDDAKIVSIAEKRDDRRAEVKALTGAEHAYASHTELYDNAVRDGIEAVFIAVEPTAHTDTETRAIDLNLPFLVEKPMTMDLKQGDEIAARVAEKGLLTAVGFQDRYLDLMEMVKAELPKHKKGGLVYGAWVGGIPGVWWWQKKSTCGGQLVEQNIHLADGLRFLYGEPLSVYATASRGIVKPGVDALPEYDTDDHSTAVIRFKDNVTATLVSACYSKNIRPRCGLFITLDDMVLDYHLRNNLVISTAGETRDIKRGNDQTLALDKAFVQAVKTGDGSLIRSPYADALKSLKMCFAANKSMETGEVVYFD